MTGLEIAVIGMAGKFPGATSVTQYWKNLCASRETITFFSAEDLEKYGISKDELDAKQYVKAKGIIDDIKFFDADFFNIKEEEAEAMDPQLRLLLEVSWSAFEDAGYSYQDTPDDVGVFLGAASSFEWRKRIDKNHDYDVLDKYRVSLITEEHYYSTQVSYRLGLSGPSMTVLSACSSSLGAIHLACRALLMGECDAALAGGVCITIPLHAGYRYHNEMIFSPDGHCRVFDRAAGGTVPGNGAGVVLLKLLENAVNDRDNIYAVIRSTSMNNDGNNKLGYIVPSVDGQAQVIKAAYNLAGIKYEDICFIEAHGTGTKLGDAIEIEALKNAFETEQTSYCAVGSVKTNIGHLDAASGIASFIKAVLCVKYRVFPPTLHFNSRNEQIDFMHSPFFINTSLIQFNKPGMKIIGGVNSFGDGGTNVHVVLEEFCSPPKNSHDVSGWFLVKLSARTVESLQNLIDDLCAYLKTQSPTDFCNAVYTLNTGRKEFANRYYVVCRDLNDFITQVEKKKLVEGVENCECQEDKGVAFILGSLPLESILDLNDWLNDAFNIYHEELINCLKVGKHAINNNSLKIQLAQVLCEKNTAGEFKYTDKTLKNLVNFIFQFSLTKFLIRLNIVPAAIGGSGMGMLIAGCLAGVLDARHVLTLLSSGYPGNVDESTLKNKAVGSGEWQQRINLVPGQSEMIVVSDAAENYRFWANHFQQVDKKDSEASEIISQELGYKILNFTSFSNLVKKDTTNVLKSGREETQLSQTSSRLNFLKSLGELWKQGVSLAWHEFYNAKENFKISLPTYSFAKKSINYIQ